MLFLLRYSMERSLEGSVCGGIWSYRLIIYFKDYEGFDIANEDDDLEEFLGLPRKNPKVFMQI